MKKLTDNALEQSRAEQSRAEQSRAEQSRAEQSRAEQSRRPFIQSLQVIRCFAFLGVFLCHTRIPSCRALGWWGVSLFFVLSGFLMVYQHSSYLKCGIVSNLKFALRKLRKLYLLYFITLVCFTIYFILQNPELLTSKGFLDRLLLNIFVVQEWIPVGFRSINGVSWYLCSIFFFWFSFPWIKMAINRIHNKSTIFVLILLLIVVDFVVGKLSFILIPLEKYCSDIQEWFVYYFPGTRLIDCTIGSLIGYLYVTLKDDDSDNKSANSLRYTITETIVVLLNIAFCFVATINSINSMITHETWWVCTLLFIPISCITIYVFAINKGKISQLLMNRCTIYIAKISSAAFLIHYVVLWLLGDVLKNIVNKTFLPYIVCVIGFPITVIMSALWSKTTSYRK